MYDVFKIAVAVGFAALTGCSSGPASVPQTAAAPAATQASAARLTDPPPPARGTMPPCQGDAFEIDLLDAIAALPKDTLEAQREQVRDWVWSVTLARAAKDTTVDDVFSPVADQPVLRDDALAHVLTLPNGTARATTTKSGKVLVLVDALNEPDLRARVLETVDDQALALGHTPTDVKVFGFKLEPGVAVASVCELESLSGKALESETLGYKQALVKNQSDLDQFLAGGVDLLTAECRTDGLALSGRRRARNEAAPVTSEHIAALAQRLNDHYISPERFGTSLAALSPSQRADELARAKTLDEIAAIPGASFFSARDENERFVKRLLDWKRDNPGVSSANIVLSATLQAQSDGRPGFSLDPEYAAKDVRVRARELAAAMTNGKTLVQKLREWGAPVPFSEYFDLDGAELESLRSQFADLSSQLDAARDDNVLAVLWASERSSSELGHLATELRVRGGQQCARYEGPLAGTEAGMTFFYTDVSAKFFARDFAKRSPEGTVPGFESVVNHLASAAWCEEEERPGTRIWFGLKNDAFARNTSGTVRFSPTATRLFAKGSPDPGSGEQETEPNASYRRFIGWWDTHYAAIADWEPQYEVLNQLMKWSVVTQHLRVRHEDECGKILRSAKFSTDARLASWSAARPKLRWADALRQFHATETGKECLPIIRSDAFAGCGVANELQGGVSAGSLEEVAGKLERPANWMSRLAGDAKPIAHTTEGTQFEKLRRGGGGVLTNVELRAKPDRVSFQAKVETGASNGAAGEATGQVGTSTVFMRAAPVKGFVKVVERSGDRVSFTESDGKLLRAGLTTYDLELGKVRVDLKLGAEPLAKRTAQRLAERMAYDSSSLADAARGIEGLNEGMLLEDGSVAVRVTDREGAPQLAVMTSGGGVRGPPSKDAQVAFWVGDWNGGRFGESDVGRPVNALKVQLFDGPGAKRFLSENPGAPLSPTTTDVSKRVERALAANQPNEAAAVLKATLPSLDSAALADLSATLSRARVLAARSGDGSAVDRLSMSVAIAARKRAAAEPGTAAQILTATRVVEPIGYPVGTALPPAIYPRGHVVDPAHAFVARALDMPETLATQTRFESADGESFQVRAVSPQGRPREQIGEPLRVATAWRPAVVVVPCSDESGSGRPRCTEPAPRDERILSKLFVARACAGSDATCGARIWKCDTNHDGALTAPPEIACVKQLSKAGPSPAAPR